MQPTLKSAPLFCNARSLTVMKEQWKAGVSFGLTSGAITTMGLMVGLHSGTHAKLAVMGGVKPHKVKPISS